MSAVPLQQRILSVIREQQPLPVKDLPRWLSDVDHIALDCGVNALMRANRISRVNGFYDVVQGGRPKQPASADPSSPPSVEEELAANLPETGYCLACDTTKPAEEFQRSKFGKLYSKCIPCMQKQVKKALATDTTVKPPTAPVMGAPAISSEQPSSPSVHGTLTADLPARDSEALSPVGAGQDSILSKLRAQLGELTRSIREHEEKARQLRQEANEQEQLVSTKRVALDEVNAVIAQLQKLVPEAFT